MVVARNQAPGEDLEAEQVSHEGPRTNDSQKKLQRVLEKSEEAEQVQSLLLSSHRSGGDEQKKPTGQKELHLKRFKCDTPE